MTKVLSGDLSSMNSSAVITLLKDTAEDSNKVLNRISTFINNSKTVCKGGGYDAVRAKMSLYLDALRKQSKICVNLSNNVVCANNSMFNYMEGYTELDNAKLPEINNSINEADRTISWLREIVYDYEYDNKGQIISVNSHTRGDQSLINSWVSVLTELKKLREKLENLESADSSAYSSIADTEVDTINFINATNGISNNSFSKSNLETNKDVADVSELQAQQISAASLNSQDPLVATSLAASSKTGEGNLYNGNTAINYLQTDPQWQDTEWARYKGDSLANDGCGPTSTAAALATILQDPSITPKTIGDKYKTSGTSTNLPFTAAKDAGLDVSDNIYTSEKSAFDAVLESGGGVIFKASEATPRSDGIRYYGGHYIAILDHNPVTDEYTICDPFSAENSTQTWTYSDITSGITNNWSAVIAPPGETVRGILEENNITPKKGIDNLYN